MFEFVQYEHLSVSESHLSHNGLLSVRLVSGFCKLGVKLFGGRTSVCTMLTLRERSSRTQL